MTEPITAQVPAWLREVRLALAAHPQILLTGNVHDLYRVPDPERGGEARYMELEEALWSVAADRGYAALLGYSTGGGLEVIAPRDQQPPVVDAVLHVAGLELGAQLTLARLRDLLTAVVDVQGRRPVRDGPVGLVLADAARLFSGETGPTDERLFLSVADRLAYRALPTAAGYNTVFWVLDRDRDLPAWFATGNHTLRTTPVPEPDLAHRLAVAGDLVGNLPEAPTEPASRAAVARRFAESSHALRVRSMWNVVRLAIGAGMPAEQIEDAVRAYRVGVPDNPWRGSGLRERLATAEETLSNRVLGQPDAVRRTVDILARSVTGLSGSHTGGQNKPRGVLLFAGPTGVGKTELAKAIAQLLFGDETAYLRFDMSEFSAEHAEARLIGAPPGYVGHDAGGELTNGLREQPFRVVLFDEIEKAHFGLLDKFLQILDDGRLTDGRGGTVYFTEALIVFTTNLGVVVPDEDHDNRPKENITPDDDLPEIDLRLREFLEKFFRHLIGRPELYNRIQQNIVVFDFLRPPVTEQIAERAVDRVVTTVRRLHGVTVTFSEKARSQLVDLATFDTRNGGRGIVSEIERVLVNPLARELFEQHREPGATLHVLELEQTGQNWRMVVEP